MAGRNLDPCAVCGGVMCDCEAVVGHCQHCGCAMWADKREAFVTCPECAEGHDRGIRIMCLAHTLPEPCPTCAAYIAGGL